MHKILFYNKFIICLYMFRALCAHHQQVKIVVYSIWLSSHLKVAAQPVHGTATFRCDDKQILYMYYNFDLLMMST